MRHHVDTVKLGRKSPHTKAMFSNMATSLLMHSRIATTLPKAKQLRRIADRLITIGKQGTVHARRRAFAMLRDKNAVSKLFDDVAHRFMDRHGGYTRILKLGHRHGDAAPMAMIEYVVMGKGEEEKKTQHHEKKKARAHKEDSKGKKVAAPKKVATKVKSATVKQAAKRSSPAHRASSKGE